MLQDFPETWIAPGHRKGLTWWIPKNISVWANICHAHSFFRAQRYNYPFSCIPQCQGKEFFLPFKFVHINKVSCLRKTKYVFYFTRYGGMHLKPRTWEERIADFIVSKISMLDIVNFRPSRNTQWNSVLKTQVSSLKKKYWEVIPTREAGTLTTDYYIPVHSSKSNPPVSFPVCSKGLIADPFVSLPPFTVDHSDFSPLRFLPQLTALFQYPTPTGRLGETWNHSNQGSR